MTLEEVTLIAAFIAAAFSLITLGLTLVAAKDAESRAAHRNILGDTIGNLGEALHKLMACSTVMIKTQSDESFTKWEEKAKDAQKRLNELRVKLRYPLWGLDSPLRTMTRIGSWTTHYRRDVTVATQFLRLADHLRENIDLAVKSSYASGNPPSWWRTFRASLAERKVLTYYENTAPRPEAEQMDALDGYSDEAP